MLIVGFNLAAADYRRSRRTVLLLSGLSAALLVLLVLQGVGWNALRREGTAVAARLGAMQSEVRLHQEQVRAVRVTIPANLIKQYEAKVAAYNQILEAFAFSWIGLLVELERSVPPGVVLAEIHPDLGTGRVALRGTAHSFEDLTKLLTGLEQRTTFRDVYLLHQSVKKPSANGPEVLEFTVNFIQERPR
ncbi:MAG TPA: PilN domain-containing protein [Candidatus Methylomirabilis sp.]